jgi:ketosteroid isomerase-like protein
MRLLAPALLGALVASSPQPALGQPAQQMPRPTSAVAPAPPTPVPDVLLGSTMEEMRAAELILDADTMALHLARSFTAIEGDARVAGAFAYLEAMRRMAERRASIRRLSFDDLRIDVYGASAVVTYRIRKVWSDRGTRHETQGWCTDVFERRDDGAWLLVHRHRP